MIRERILLAFSSTKKRKSKLVFDTEKFVSEEAQTRFHDSVVKRNPIAERGLCITWVNWPSIKIILGQENGITFVINQRRLSFLLLENFMLMLLNITIGRFLGARLMPVRHFSDITKDRACCCIVLLRKNPWI